MHGEWEANYSISHIRKQQWTLSDVRAADGPYKSSFSGLRIVAIAVGRRAHSDTLRTGNGRVQTDLVAIAFERRTHSGSRSDKERPVTRHHIGRTSRNHLQRYDRYQTVLLLQERRMIVAIAFAWRSHSDSSGSASRCGRRSSRNRLRTAHSFGRSPASLPSSSSPLCRNRLRAARSLGSELLHREDGRGRIAIAFERRTLSFGPDQREDEQAEADHDVAIAFARRTRSDLLSADSNALILLSREDDAGFFFFACFAPSRDLYEQRHKAAHSFASTDRPSSGALIRTGYGDLQCSQRCIWFCRNRLRSAHLIRTPSGQRRGSFPRGRHRNRLRAALFIRDPRRADVSKLRVHRVAIAFERRAHLDASQSSMARRPPRRNRLRAAHSFGLRSTNTTD